MGCNLENVRVMEGNMFNCDGNHPKPPSDQDAREVFTIETLNFYNIIVCCNVLSFIVLHCIVCISNYNFRNAGSMWIRTT